MGEWWQNMTMKTLIFSKKINAQRREGRRLKSLVVNRAEHKAETQRFMTVFFLLP
jgi:hypothetical protein